MKEYLYRKEFEDGTACSIGICITSMSLPFLITKEVYPAWFTIEIKQAALDEAYTEAIKCMVELDEGGADE